jgi:2-oxoglutarate ferredoxin oxidoreductase subunit gamma
MSRIALKKHLSDLKNSGVLLVDSSCAGNIPKNEVKTYQIPTIETAKKEFGVSIYANMIMLGALIKKTSLADEDSIEKAIIESVPKRTLEKNLKAFKKGLILK